MLPPTLGGVASLNLFTSVVGASGGGKDIANAAGADAVEFYGAGMGLITEARYTHPGTGEGLAKTLGQDRRAHLQVPDVGTFESLSERKGQTLSTQLLSAWMGQPIGFTNNSRATSTALGQHTYRLCLSVGVQPENAGFFLDRQKDGFPQRFLWLSTIDPGHLPYKPEPMGSLLVRLPNFGGDPENRVVMEIPPEVTDEIWDQHHRVMMGDPDVDPLDKHTNLTRLKTAAGLDILHGHTEVTEEGWGLAGHLIEVSTRVREGLREAVAAKRRQENSARAHATADREAIIGERRRDQRWKQAEKAILSKFRREKRTTRRVVQRAMDSDIAPFFPSVFDSLIDQGILIPVEGEGRSIEYEIAGSDVGVSTPTNTDTSTAPTGSELQK